jgi:hypothetical protein
VVTNYCIPNNDLQAERRRDTDDIALKFWSFDHRNQQYIHTNNKISSHTKEEKKKHIFLCPCWSV